MKNYKPAKLLARQPRATSIKQDSSRLKQSELALAVRWKSLDLTVEHSLSKPERLFSTRNSKDKVSLYLTDYDTYNTIQIYKGFQGKLVLARE